MKKAACFYILLFCCCCFTTIQGQTTDPVDDWDYLGTDPRDLSNIPTMGYVGIGITTPNSKLHIHECGNTEYVEGSAAGLSGKQTNVSTSIGNLTLKLSDVSAARSVQPPLVDESQAFAVKIYLSTYDSLNNALLHYIENSQILIQPPTDSSLISSCNAALSVCSNRIDALQSSLAGKNPSVDTIPLFSAVFYAIAQVQPAAADLQNQTNDFYLFLLSNLKRVRPSACGNIPINAAFVASRVNLKLTTLQNPNQGVDLGLINDDAYWQNRLGGNFNLLGVGQVPAMRIIGGSGYVGVNKFNPAHQLDVEGASLRVGKLAQDVVISLKSSGTNKWAEVTASTAANRLVLNSNGTPVTTNGLVYIGAEAETVNLNNVAKLTVNTGGQSGDLMRLSTGVAPADVKMVVRNNGNVGIGTPLPGSPLHVRFSAAQANNSGLILEKTGNGYNTVSYRVNASEKWAAGINTAANGQANYVIYGNAAERITVLPNGNVGIGVSNPLQKLTVDGFICAKDIRVRLTGAPCWPDYVFDPNYPLRTLSELREYVTENRHLPDLPPAAEIEAEGLQVGETMQRMVKIMEEQQLYILQLEERIKKLEADK